MRRLTRTAAFLALAACGGGGESRNLGTAGGIPITTDLHAATGLPKGSVYSVARGAEGWRVLHRSPGSDAAIAVRLCALQGKRPASIRPERIASSHQIAGAHKIIITCRG